MKPTRGIWTSKRRWWMGTALQSGGRQASHTHGCTSEAGSGSAGANQPHIEAQLRGREQRVFYAREVPRQRHVHRVLALSQAQSVLLEPGSLDLAPEATVPGSAVDAP